MVAIVIECLMPVVLSSAWKSGDNPAEIDLVPLVFKYKDVAFEYWFFSWKCSTMLQRICNRYWRNSRSNLKIMPKMCINRSMWQGWQYSFIHRWTSKAWISTISWTFSSRWSHSWILWNKCLYLTSIHLDKSRCYEPFLRILWTNDQHKYFCHKLSILQMRYSNRGRCILGLKKSTIPNIDLASILVYLATWIYYRFVVFDCCPLFIVLPLEYSYSASCNCLQPQ